LFTSADNYVIALTQEPKPSEAILLLAAGLAVDTVYKESQLTSPAHRSAVIPGLTT
jgi:hypothetical protein